MKMEVAPSPQFKFHQWELSHMVTASSKVGLENVVYSWIALGPGRREQFSGNNLSTKMIISGPCKTPRLFHPFIHSLFFMAIPHTPPYTWAINLLYLKYILPVTSLVVQWLRIHLPMQGMWVQSLVRELRSHMPRGKYATCHMPASHN